jgi:hypothetical protein
MGKVAVGCCGATRIARLRIAWLGVFIVYFVK